MRRHFEFLLVGTWVGGTAASMDCWNGNHSDVPILWVHGIGAAVGVICLIGLWWTEGRR